MRTASPPGASRTRSTTSSSRSRRTVRATASWSSRAPAARAWSVTRPPRRTRPYATRTPVPVSPLDAARSSRAPKLAAGGDYQGLNFVAYAEDAVSYLYWTSYNGTAANSTDAAKCINQVGAANITTAELKLDLERDLQRRRAQPDVEQRLRLHHRRELARRSTPTGRRTARAPSQRGRPRLGRAFPGTASNWPGQADRLRERDVLDPGQQRHRVRPRRTRGRRDVLLLVRTLQPALPEHSGSAALSPSELRRHVEHDDAERGPARASRSTASPSTRPTSTTSCLAWRGAPSRVTVSCTTCTRTAPTRTSRSATRRR